MLSKVDLKSWNLVANWLRATETKHLSKGALCSILTSLKKEAGFVGKYNIILIIPTNHNLVIINVR